MAKWNLAPVEGGTLEALRAAMQRHVSDLSVILGEIEQLELQVKGQAGYTAKLDSILDLQGHRVCNAQQSLQDNDYITRAEARSFGLYAREGKHRARGPIEAMNGIVVSPAVGAADALPLGQVRTMLEGLLPPGVILLWSGSTASIPVGWALCNGSSGTPDLRDRFVVGAGSTYAVGATGGATTANLAHTHADGTYATGAPSATTVVDNDGALSTVAVGSSTHTHDVTGASATALSSTTSILPPYYALAYIMKL